MVGRVDPQPVADAAFRDGTRRTHSVMRASGGGMSKAVQYWFSIVIVPASTVSSIELVVAQVIERSRHELVRDPARRPT